MLMARSATKKVTLGQAKESSSIWHREPPISPLKVPLPPSRTVSGQSTPTEAMPRKRTKSSNSRQYVIDDADGNKTSFFSKNRVARRVKTNEDNRARAREHEVDFEIHSASGLSSGGTSPQEGDNLGKKKSKKGGDDDEKWMGRSAHRLAGIILIRCRYPDCQRSKEDGPPGCCSAQGIGAVGRFCWIAFFTKTFASSTTIAIASRQTQWLSTTHPRIPRCASSAYPRAYSRQVDR